VTRDADASDELAFAVGLAHANATPLAIQAGCTKDFLGEAIDGEPLDISGHRGIVNYQPGELVLTARAGTPLTEIEAALAEQGQMLAFEPPHYGETATLGGTIAAGLSGPARPFTGAARDFVLGARIINARGEILRFGGEVMKNVAGYDLSRLMAGAYGTLGVLLELSLKVLPRPGAQTTLMFEHDAATAIEQFGRWQRRPWPITGAYWENGCSHIRLAGASASVASAQQQLGGETLIDDAIFWRGVREQQRPFFATARALWRLSVPPATPRLEIDGECAIDWGGAQRWLSSDADADTIRSTVAAHGGHASVYRGHATPRFHPLPEAMMTLHRRVKQSMDPADILNRGRLYPDF